MDALGFGLFSIGAFIIYAAYKNEHPWTMFQSVIKPKNKPKNKPKKAP